MVFKLMQPVLRLELDLYGKKKIFWVLIFTYFTIEMNLNPSIIQFEVNLSIVLHSLIQTGMSFHSNGPVYDILSLKSSFKLLGFGTT